MIMFFSFKCTLFVAICYELWIQNIDYYMYMDNRVEAINKCHRRITKVYSHISLSMFPCEIVHTSDER